MSSRKEFKFPNRHTTTFTDAERDYLIEQIVTRALNDYPTHRINVARLRNGLLCAHRTKPIRLVDLLNTCAMDFPSDVLMGVYRHYDPNTDTMRDGWTAQHSEPHEPDIWDLLFGNDGDDEDDNEE